ncbi:uncharacterized protein LOC119599893 [Lucilia sericata]|uniref:uncharacterized protein LOC119599893 n=1 Tax=Lucilia sericata TaxID=13632 RepID=UPI0018A8055A|nr:uncharacterized protein LOC119599893 [Lucilia sericata]
MERRADQIKIIILLFSIFVTTSANNFDHCFDILDKYSKNQIKNIYSFDVEKVANTSPANEIFECYLKETRESSVKTNAEKYFDVFRKCNEYKKQQLLYIELHHIEELTKMGLPLYLEQRAVRRIEGGEGNASEILKLIQNDLCTKIEMSDQYTEYRSLVRVKLETVEKSGKNSIAIHSSIVFIVLIHYLFNVF